MEARKSHMILFDTNEIINMINNPQSPVWNIYYQEESCICGITITEIFRGIKLPEEIESVKQILSGFNFIEIEKEDWEQAGILIARLRDNGLTVPFQDAIIAFMGIKTGAKILSSDKHFKMIQICDKRLQLVE